MSDRHTVWSVTINNPTTTDEEDIARARQRGWTITGQLEMGENGTPHYQLMAETGQQRFAALKKAFPRGHIEPARKPQALKQYVTKSDTRVQELQESQQYYPSLSQTYRLIVERYNTYDKEGWSACSYPTEFYREEDQQKLDRDPMQWLDKEIEHLIMKGYHVESMTSNPNVRAAWKRHYKAIITRAHLEIEKEYQKKLNGDKQEIKEEQISTNPEEGRKETDEDVQTDEEEDNHD